MQISKLPCSNNSNNQLIGIHGAHQRRRRGVYMSRRAAGSSAPFCCVHSDTYVYIELQFYEPWFLRLSVLLMSQRCFRPLCSSHLRPSRHWHWYWQAADSYKAPDYIQKDLSFGYPISEHASMTSRIPPSSMNSQQLDNKLRQCSTYNGGIVCVWLRYENEFENRSRTLYEVISWALWFTWLWRMKYLPTANLFKERPALVLWSCIKFQPDDSDDPARIILS